MYALASDELLGGESAVERWSAQPYEHFQIWQQHYLSRPFSTCTRGGTAQKMLLSLMGGR